MKYDDGFVAYINGMEVASRNAPATVAWNSAADAARDDANALIYKEIDISDYISALQAGGNVLAIQVLNVSARDDDLLLIPELVAGGYNGSLNNAGERIELEYPIGGIIHDFKYKDGWYGHTDGEGFSLTVRDPSQDLLLWDDNLGWRASAAPGGTPGTTDTLTAPGAVIINEVLAHQDRRRPAT